jgi:5-methylthioadenosine/S-adenosylhomocysteine deaminase
MKRILIHGATILTLDPRIGDLRGDILIEGSRIVAVATSIPTEDAEVIPA